MTGVFFSFNSIRLKPDVPLQKLQLSVLTETQHLICHPVTKLEEIVEPTLKIFKAEQVSRSHPRATTSIADTGLERCTRGAIEPTKTTLLQHVFYKCLPDVGHVTTTVHTLSQHYSPKKHLMSLSSASSMTSSLQERFAEVQHNESLPQFLGPWPAYLLTIHRLINKRRRYHKLFATPSFVVLTSSLTTHLGAFQSINRPESKHDLGP